MSDTGTGSQNYTSPNFVVSYSMPSSIPDPLKPFFKPIYTAFQNIIQTLITFCGIAPRSPGAIISSAGDPTAILSNNVHRFYATGSEVIAEGAAINIFASLGVLFIRNANATDNTKPCYGFCNQPGGLAIGQVGEVILNDGVVTGLSGLTQAAIYYLSTVDGEYTSTPPTAAGNYQQFLGVALDGRTLRFWTGNTIQH